MDEPIQLVMGALCFGLLILGVIWQFKVWGKMQSSGTVATMVFGLPLIFGIFIVMGGITWSVFQYLDPTVHVDFDERRKLIISLAILAAIIVGKSLVGVFLLCATLSWALYRWYQHDVTELIPVFQFVVSSFMNWAPPMIKVLYSWVLLGYISLTTLRGSF